MSDAGRISPAITRPQAISRKSTTFQLSDSIARDPALVAEFDLLRSSLRAAEEARDDNLEELVHLRAALDDLQKEYLRLEEELVKHESDAQLKVDELKLQVANLRSDQKNAGSDRDKLIQEREHLAQKQEEMSDTIQRLHQRSASMSPVGKDIERVAEEGSPFAHSRNSSHSNLIALQITNSTKDRQIQTLEGQVKNLESKLNLNISHGDPRIVQLEEEVKELRSEIRVLREDNESYQTLLQDRTINGEFAHSQFMQSTTSVGKYQSLRGTTNPQTLASELEAAAEQTPTRPAQDIAAADRNELESEVLKLQETNKALTLYVNTIVTRMLNTEGFEHLLAKDARDMQPARPVNRPVDSPTSGFLQRTKSVLMRKPIAPGAEHSAETEMRSPPPSFRDSFSTDKTPINTRSLQDHSPSPSRSAAESLSSLGRRSIPTDNRSPSKSEAKANKGLRPLQSASAADNISTREARRLSAQFSVISQPQEDAKFQSVTTEANKTRRSSWMAWLGSKSDKASETLQESAEHDGAGKTHSSADLRPLQEIDAEIEDSVKS